MNDQVKSKIIVRHALCWGAAFITPPIVMVILDMMDKHTPTSVAVFSSMALMLIFPVSNAFLSSGLDSATKSEIQEDENLA